MGGTGSKQEDQIITVAIEKAIGTKLIYVPFKGGGDVAVQLVGNHVDSTVNNPIEAVAHWRAGELRALCVFDDEPMPYKAKVTDTQSWNDIPDLQGSRRADRLHDAARHLHAARRDAGSGGVLRGPVEEGARDAGLEEVHRGRCVQLDLHDRRASTRSGSRSAEGAHKTLMKEAGFLAK